MILSLIAAAARNRVIGADNALPWRLSADLRRFKQLTMGHHLIVGRKTYESIDGILPGRKLVVVTRQSDYAPPSAGTRVQVAHSIDEALRLAMEDDEIFVGGGEEIYRQAISKADRIYLTAIDRDYQGDTFFPEIDPEKWDLKEREAQVDERNGIPFEFRVYKRRCPLAREV